MSEKVKLGIVGGGGRGRSFKGVCDAIPEIELVAVCDTDPKNLDLAQERLGVKKKYTDYLKMVEESNIDAVLIGTPANLHVPQAIQALQRGKHVLSEVPAAVSVEQCRELVLVARSSKSIYMMAENCIYFRPNMVIAEMVHRGLFGQTYYAEGEYLHELKAYNELTPWRRKWQTGINGNTYPTHSLGPILRWMPGDRVVQVACAGSGRHHRDPRGDQYELEDSVVTLCRMRSGGLVKLRLDMTSDRPHAMSNYQLQGTDGCYESARAAGEADRIWLRSLSKEANRWMTLDEVQADFIPKIWRQRQAQAGKYAHGGGDFIEMLDFVDAALSRCPPAIGIDAAMDMTLPGLISQQSIVQGARWIDVPDSRDWQRGT